MASFQYVVFSSHQPIMNSTIIVNYVENKVILIYNDPVIVAKYLLTRLNKLSVLTLKSLSYRICSNITFNNVQIPNFTKTKHLCIKFDKRLI